MEVLLVIVVVVVGALVGNVLLLLGVEGRGRDGGELGGG